MTNQPNLSTENGLTPELILLALESGMMDASLEVIREAVRARIDIVDKQAAYALTPGQEFLIKDCSPKKYNGIRVKFLKHEGVWLVCELVDFVPGSSGTIRLRTSHVGTILG